MPAVESDDNYPLFPLRTVLFPGGRLSLRIFERRYLDLVRDSMREGRSFGIAWLSDGGSEVLGTETGGALPGLAAIGSEAVIVDWDQLPDGLLGIVVEGRRRFRLHNVQHSDSGLYRAKVDWLPEASASPLPEQTSELQRLLQQLGEHPHIQRLGMSLNVDEAGLLANRLAQVLPIPPLQAYRLLAEDEPLARLSNLQDLLDEMAQ